MTPYPAIETRENFPDISHPETAEEYLLAYHHVRSFTEKLCDPLVTEDYVIQTMPDVSPTKWHLAHTTWFWESFVLTPHRRGYGLWHPQYSYLFNSYYNSAGPQYCRPRRGVLSRPTVSEVYRYRAHVDEEMRRFLAEMTDKEFARLRSLLVLGLHHEQQHQELMLTDIKHVFATNPLMPAYEPEAPIGGSPLPAMKWIKHDGGMIEMGHAGKGFAFDNETPRHQTFVYPYQIASRLITNGEYMDFIEESGYQRHNLWLSDGWKHLHETQSFCPLYWHNQDGHWFHYTLNGYRQINREEPVCHVSYYEADAFARWAGARLPGESEWEHAAATAVIDGNFVESRRFHPAATAAGDSELVQIYGDVWEWTSAPYAPYHGFTPAEGAVGEYNAKFMCNQFVLRGGSCATSITHIRPTYRNFFPPHAQWQFTGIRLAKDA